MSDAIKYLSTHDNTRYNSRRPEDQRALAVAAALELIALNLQGAHSGGLLESELDNLADYADKIQEALKVRTS